MSTVNCPTCIQALVQQTWKLLYCRKCNKVWKRWEVEPAKKHVRGKSRTTRGRATRQEKHNAKKVAGRVTSNSGAGDEKADVRIKGILRDENKTTKAKSFVLKLADLQKVAGEAEDGEIPVLTVSFEDDLRKQYRVISNDWFLELLELYKEDRCD